MSQSELPFYSHNGFCPICEKDAVFTSKDNNYRDELICLSCVNHSVPRERAMALVMKRLIPDWRSKDIHESSPSNRGISEHLRTQCKRYIASHYFPDHEPGAMVQGARNENLEAQTLASESLDLAISLDVMEHVNNPVKAMRETARTLKEGGYCLFTAPTDVDRAFSERCARFLDDGSEEIISGEAEYHGNPVNEKGSLVTFRYGYDLPELIWKFTGLSVQVARFYDPRHGVIGRMTEVYICHKPVGVDLTENTSLPDNI